MTAPTSPSTPSRKRKSLRLSAFDQSGNASPSPYASGPTTGTTFSRRSSRTSQTSYQPQSPVTPRPMSSRSSKYSLHRRKSSRASVNSMSSIVQGEHDGLGNLADELEDALDDTEEHDPTQASSFLEGLREGDVSEYAIQSSNGMSGIHDLSIGAQPQSPAAKMLKHSTSNSLSPQQARRKSSKHKRTDSAYDGSDYGSMSDTEDELSSFPPLFRKSLRELEKLTYASTHNDDSVSEAGGVMKRTTSAIHDLGPPQSGTEYGITRLSTMYNSMSTHRTYAQRDLFSQSHSLVYSNTASILPEELIDLLLSEIGDLSSALPFMPTQNPLLSLQILAAQTSDLTHTLQNLTDLLQELKLVMTQAQRKLKSVKDMVEDMRTEEDLVEQSIMLIQAHDWNRRCEKRMAAQQCKEILQGFGDRWGLYVPPMRTREVPAVA